MTTVQQEKPNFWDRQEIRSAQHVLDVWGTTKRHWRLGGYGVPNMDWIDMRDERFAVIEKRGRKWIEEAKNPAFAQFGKLSRAFLIVLGVDAAIGELGNPPLLHALLAHRYPQDGPLAYSSSEIAYRQFWCESQGIGAKWALQTVGWLRGRYTAKTVDQLLAQMERDFLEYLAFCGVKR